MEQLFVTTGIVLTIILIILIWGFVFWSQFKKIRREYKNYERGLKMIRLRIHLPPASTDLDTTNRDQRDVTDEVISQAQIMYNILASTSVKGWKTSIVGQRHMSFEIIANDGLIQYYAVVPMTLVEIVKQAVSTAYPSVMMEEVRGDNIFSQIGKVTGTIGGELSLKKDYIYPIATYQDTKQDVSRSILNALSAAKKDDGVAIQVLVRPADPNWIKHSTSEADNIREEKQSGKSGSKIGYSARDVLEALWKPPVSEEKPETSNHPMSKIVQDEIEAIESKTRYPGFETLIRIVVSSNTSHQAQALLQNVIASFSLFNTPQYNGFEFKYSQKIDELTAAYIMRFFPQVIKDNILNAVELATIFHLPSQKDIPTSQVKRQNSKQVDGPTEIMDEGLLLGYNEFRGIKKPIRLSQNDRRRHTYFIGQTGTGKSVLLENLAYQDMMDGRGFAFIDPHGDSAEKILGMVPRERVEDIVYFNPGDMENPVGLNLFEFESDDQRDFLIQECIQMLYKLYDPGHTGIIGPRFEHWFRNAALTIMSDPAGSTFIDIPQVFNDQAFADYKLKYVKDQTVIDFWKKEMAQTTESSKSEMLGWFASKFGAFLSNEMMRNIIGQTKSGVNIRDIMDKNKILIVNLSKGKTGELNSMLLGMIFIMKFQVAAMSRANILESERVDFCLYVDEFQNFATESFESILSEARKYRLNIIVANQFMTQLTDKIREAIIGNVGTMIAGRVGVTDAELLTKKFAPTFDVEDLTKLPNYQTITSVLVNNVPSAPFSMNLIPPMAQPNNQLKEALKRLSASKHGLSRVEVGNQIMDRLGAGDRQRAAIEFQKNQAMSFDKVNDDANFLDDWLKKRNQLKASESGAYPAKNTISKTYPDKVSTKPSDQQNNKNDVEPNDQRFNSGAIDFRNDDKNKYSSVSLNLRK